MNFGEIRLARKQSKALTEFYYDLPEEKVSRLKRSVERRLLRRPNVINNDEWIKIRDSEASSILREGMIAKKKMEQEVRLTKEINEKAKQELIRGLQNSGRGGGGSGKIALLDEDHQ